MRSDIAHVATISHHGSTRVSKKFGGRVRFVHDPDHLYDDERGGIHSSARRRDYYAINHCPIAGFIRKNVGRPWADVYSEFCAVNDSRSLRGRDMRKALSHEIKVKGIYEGVDGVIYEYRAGGYWERSKFDKELDKYVELPSPIHYVAKNTPVTDYYVHPRTGLVCAPLCKEKGYKDPFAYKRGKKNKEPTTMITLAYGYKEEKFDWCGGTYTTKVPVEWYQRELCGRRPRSRFYGWFHYIKKTTVKTHWERVDGSKFAKNAHFDGVEVAPYVDTVQERYYKVRPDLYRQDSLGFWHVLKTETTRKEHKRSCNRKDMAVIRDYLAKQAG